MDLPSILAKTAGVILFAWTGRSIYKHVKEKQAARKIQKADTQSLSESFLNNLLLYLWLAFMVAFSVGMFVNN